MKTRQVFSTVLKGFAQQKGGRVLLLSAGGRGNPCGEQENKVGEEKEIPPPLTKSAGPPAPTSGSGVFQRGGLRSRCPRWRGHPGRCLRGSRCPSPACGAAGNIIIHTFICLFPFFSAWLCSYGWVWGWFFIIFLLCFGILGRFCKRYFNAVLYYTLYYYSYYN